MTLREMCEEVSESIRINLDLEEDEFDSKFSNEEIERVVREFAEKAIAHFAKDLANIDTKEDMGPVLYAIARVENDE